VSLFSGLAHEELPELNTLFPEVPFAVGELVYESGTPAASLFAMAERTVKLVRHTPGSRETVTVFDLARPQEVAEFTC